MSDKNQLFQLLMTASDKDNLVKLLNRVPTKGIEEAQMLVAYAQGIQNAPTAPVVVPAQNEVDDQELETSKE